MNPTIWPWRADDTMNAVTTPSGRPEERGFSRWAGIVDFIAAYPLAGDGISGTGGARKVRFAGKGKGKSGGLALFQ